MRYLCSLLFVLASFYRADASTLSGNISNDTTLTIVNSPYYVTGNLILMPGYVLTIDPGVEIVVDSNRLLEIRGKLVVNGTANAHVSIHGNTASTRYFWLGLRFSDYGYPMPAQADVNYCDISNTQCCEAIQGNTTTPGTFSYKHCSFINNVLLNGSSQSQAKVVFDSCLIKNNLVGLDYNQPKGVLINCVIDSNDVGLNGGDSVINCIFINNNLAIRSFKYVYNCDIHYNNIAVSGSFSSSVFINNKVKRNNTGIEAKGFTNAVFSGNQLCDNGSYDFYANTVDTCNIAGTCWCSSDSAYVQGRIKDGRTVTGKGLVKFSPLDTNCITIPPPPPPPPPTLVNIARQFQPTLYPNPVHTNNDVHIKMAATAGDKFAVADMLGRRHACTPRSTQDGYVLTIEGLSAGTYFVSIHAGDKTTTQRLVVVE